MVKDQETYTRVKIGAENAENKEADIRIWLPGTAKQIVAALGAEGFEVLTKRPSRAAEPKPKAEKKRRKARKPAAKKEPVAA